MGTGHIGLALAALFGSIVIPSIDSANAEYPLMEIENLRITDSADMTVSNLEVAQEFSFQADIRNNQNKELDLDYIVQIKNSDGFTVMLSWISYVIPSQSSAKVAIPWMPEIGGTYYLDVFVWESVSNPIPLTASLSKDVQVSNRLYVLTENELLRLDENRLTSVKKLDSSFSKISWDGTHFYLASKIGGGEGMAKKLLILDAKFNEVDSFNIRKIYDFDVRDGIAYLLVNEGLMLLDTNKKMPDAILQVEGFVKPAHDIIIRDNYAYLLDNIVMPLYIHIIDISDPRNPIKHTKEFEGVNSHLAAQDVVEGKWYVLEVMTVMNGHFEFVNVYDSKPRDLESLPEHYELLSYEWPDDFESVKDQMRISSIKTDGNILYCLGYGQLPGSFEFSGLRFAIFSLTEDGEELASLDLEDSGKASNIVLMGKKLYLGGERGVHVIDVSDPYNPVVSDVLETESPVRSLILAN